MPRLRTAKAVASRIDLKYFKRWHRFRGTRMILSILLGRGGLAGWGVYWVQSNQSIYNPGPLVQAHAFFENNCAACHDADGKGGWVQSVSDSACLQCHDAAIHHKDQSLQFVSAGAD